MTDNSVAAQIQTPQPQQPASLLQTAMAIQKAKQAFQGSDAMANPVRPTAFNAGGDD